MFFSKYTLFLNYFSKKKEKNNSLLKKCIIFAAAIRKECKDILLYSFTITTANERATTIIRAAPNGRRLPVYSCGLW